MSGGAVRRGVMRLPDMPRRLGRCRRGNAAVEMALLAPIFTLFLMGAVDVGLLFVESIRLTGAARSGLHRAYVLLAGVGQMDATFKANVVAAAVAAVREAAGEDGQSLDVAATIECRCPVQPTVPRDCNSSCPGGGTPPMWVDVTVAGQKSLLLGLPGLPDPFTVSESAELRVR